MNKVAKRKMMIMMCIMEKNIIKMKIIVRGIIQKEKRI